MAGGACALCIDELACGGVAFGEVDGFKALFPFCPGGWNNLFRGKRFAEFDSVVDGSCAFVRR